MEALNLPRYLEDLVAAEIEAQCLGEPYFFAVHTITALAPPANGVMFNLIIGRANPLIGEPALLWGVKIHDVRAVAPEPVREMVTDAMTKLASLVRELMGIPGTAVHTPGG